MSGVSNASSKGKKVAAAEFFAYVSNSMQSLADVLRSNFAQPYRYSHVTSSNWIEEAGMDRGLAADYTAAVRHINSENTAMELRIDVAPAFRVALDEEVYEYLVAVDRSSLTPDEATELRESVTLRLEDRIRDVIVSQDQDLLLESL